MQTMEFHAGASGKGEKKSVEGILSNKGMKELAGVIEHW